MVETKDNTIFHRLRCKFDPGYAIGELVVQAFQEAATETVREISKGNPRIYFPRP